MGYLKILEQFIEKNSNSGELGNFHKTIDDYHPILETPKRNTTDIEILYTKGNLRIEAPKIKSLFRFIRREFPTGSIVLHDGAIYVAFYYLPLLLKVVEQSFGSIGADSDIPDLEGVRRFLHLGVVNLEVALAAEMDNPVTKLLLKQKSPDEVAEITRELKAELGRSLWVDAIWDAVRKGAPLSEEMSNGEEFDGNAQSIVDKGLTDNTNFFQDESQTSGKYNEKGGNKEMGFMINVEDVIEAGVYEATISGVETKEGKFGPVLVVAFKLDDGRLLDSLFPLPAKVSNRTGLLIKKALGETKRLDSDALIGKKVKIFVEHVERNGHTYANVTKIL